MNAFSNTENWGPVHRVYFGRDNEVLVILLTGGTKRRQQRDIETAKVSWTTSEMMEATMACDEAWRAWSPRAPEAFGSTFSAAWVLPYSNAPGLPI